MGEQGSVARLFERKSQITVPQEKVTEEKLMELTLDAGVEDIRSDGVNWEVISPPEAHEPVLAAIHKAGIETASADVAMIANTLVKVEGKEASTMLKLAEAMEEHDDVQNVYANFDIDDSVMEALAQ